MTSYNLKKITKLSQNDSTYQRALKFTTLFIVMLISSELTNWLYFHSPAFANVHASQTVPYIWTCRIIFAIAGALWVGESKNLLSRITAGALTFLLFAHAFRLGHNNIPPAFVIISAYTITAAGSLPCLYEKHSRKVSALLIAGIVAISVALFIALRFVDSQGLLV